MTINEIKKLWQFLKECCLFETKKKEFFLRAFSNNINKYKDIIKKSSILYIDEILDTFHEYLSNFSDLSNDNQKIILTNFIKFFLTVYEELEQKNKILSTLNEIYSKKEIFKNFLDKSEILSLIFEKNDFAIIIQFFENSFEIILKNLILKKKLLNQIDIVLLKYLKENEEIDYQKLFFYLRLIQRIFLNFEENNFKELYEEENLDQVNTENLLTNKKDLEIINYFVYSHKFGTLLEICKNR